MEMAAHLVVLLSLSCTDPVVPTTTPPNALIVSIPNCRSKPSGLPCTTSTLILAESPSSMDMETTLTMFLQSSRCSHLPSSKIDIDLHLQLSVSNLYHSAPNTASCQHRCLSPGVPCSHLGGGRRLVLMHSPLVCFLSSSGPSVHIHCIGSTGFLTFSSPLRGDL